MDNSDSKRTPNFSATEERTLVALVTKYKIIIECKKTDAEANIQKKAVWVELAEEFNSQGVSVPRCEEVLRNKYRNLKKRSKKRFAEEKCFVRGTGGGPAKEIKISDIDSQLKDIIGKQITGRSTEFDDDGTIMVIVENGANQEESSNSILSDNEEIDAVISNPSPASLMDRSSVDPEETLVNDDISASEILMQQPGPSGVKRYGDWGSYSPAKLRTPKSGPLIPKIRPSDGAKKPSKNKITNKVTTWLESKTECVNLDRQIRLEQHQLHMQQMREKHAQALKFAAEEHALKMQLMKEKYQAN